MLLPCEEDAMAPSADKVALYTAIRRDSAAGMSGRALHKYGVGRWTVTKALRSAWPEPRKDAS
ncbi:hypothetical protein GCM10009678_73850 [Actinomadura kijaniata]|uniref:Uncharacterized protein n=1 Tax=Actinomadura namibiensis TaxID=182080 RepID=A0A7W3LRZ0_ACTNM|nr:hypothetical protein [Actinomadura namibiensis]